LASMWEHGCSVVETTRWRSKVELAKIKASNIKGAHTLEEKQLHFVGFAMELFYDLLLSPSLNISQAPGYEGPLGVKRTSTEAATGPVTAGPTEEGSEEAGGDPEEGSGEEAAPSEAASEAPVRRGNRKKVARTMTSV
jgi:hypothetical protein